LLLDTIATGDLTGVVWPEHHLPIVAAINPELADATSQAGESSDEGEQTDRASFDWLRFHDPATGQIPPGIRQRELDFAQQLPRRSGDLSFGAPGGLASDKQPKTDPWLPRGPYNIGGRTRALAFDLSDPTSQTLLAGAVSGGMWRTTDDGVTWTKTSDDDALHNISCIAQDSRPGHQQIWYYGTGEARGSSTGRNGDLYRGDGIWKSSDGGLSWSLLPATSTSIPQATDQPFDYVWRIAVDLSESVNDEIYAATSGLIYRSLDGGGSWTLVLGDPDSSSIYADVAITSTGVVYAGLGGDGLVRGLFRSLDGVTWTDISSPNFNAVYTRLVLAIAPSNENIVWVSDSERTGGTQSGLHRYTYLSGDGSGAGGNWYPRTAMLQDLPHNVYHSYPYYTQRGYNQCLAIKPDNPNTVLLGGVHMWRSSDAFVTRDEIVHIGGWLYNGHHADCHAFVYQPGSTDVVYTATDGGVHKTPNVNWLRPNWFSLNNAYDTTQFFTVAIDQELSGNATIVGGTQDNGTLRTDSSDPWWPWVELVGGGTAPTAPCAMRRGPMTTVAPTTSATCTGSGRWRTGPSWM